MKHQETICVQGNYNPGTGEPRVLPIYQSTTYAYDTCEDMGKAFNLELNTHLYTRISNPTLSAVADKINALEGGVGAVLTSSGQTANMIAVLNICHSGENILASGEIYGGTVNLFSKTLKEMGIETRYFDIQSSDEEIEKLIDGKTRLIFGETLSNPSLAVFDIERFAALAHRNGLPLIIDNTFPTPINCRPFEFGADIVTHSTTKYMDGHACSTGGAIVDSGNFDWTKYPEKFSGLTAPDESYHGLVYTEAFGKAAYITKATTHLMRDTGAQASPINAFILNLGLESLHLRVERHCRNAQKIAEYLAKNPKIGSINYPSLEGSKYYDLCKKYLKNGSSGVISFCVKGGRDASVKFLDNLKLARIVTHVADARTCVLHPASTTHRQLTDEQLTACGITPDLVRLSVGIENVDDIIEDIENALNA